MKPSEEGLVKALAVTQREMRRLDEHNPGPYGSSLRGRTRAEERRLRGDDQQGALTVEDELQIALAVQYEAELERAFGNDAGVSIVMPTGRIQDLPPSSPYLTPSFYDPHPGRPSSTHSASRLTVSSTPGVSNQWTRGWSQKGV